MKRWKKLVSTTVVAFMAGVLFWGTYQIQAADIVQSEGTVTVDLENFELVESTITDTSEFGLVSQDSANSRYLLHYENSFTDRNNIGCTYRSSQKFDMTDVIAIEIYAYTQQDSNDKLLLYVDPESSTYYHRMDRDDLTEDLVAGDGTIQEFSYFYYAVYGSTPQDYKFSIDQRYGSEYVYIGLSHEWQLHDAKIYLDNKTIVSTTEGCVNLKLKKHNITLLQPEEFTLVNADGEEVVEAAYSNLSLGLENGTADVGETGRVYRDETVTFNYTLENAELCDLVGYKFYSDANKENLLYTMDVSESSNKSTFVFDAALIQKLEEKTGAYKLGNIYLEPIFTAREVTFDFSSVVEENDGLEVVCTDSTGNTYVLREKESKDVIGTFVKNAADNIGDILTLDYTPNEAYAGNYKFSYYQFRVCSASNQVDTTPWAKAAYSEDKHDIETKYTDTYFWVRAHISKEVTVTLKNKAVDYTSEYCSIDEAKVYCEGAEISVANDNIIYEYYTDASCAEEYKMSELPINAGTYYVKAIIKSSSEYEATESNVATLTILKASPEIVNVKAKSITYGEALSASEGFEDEYEVYGVNGTKLTGTFEWVDSSIVPDAGTQEADIWFTVSSVFELNYRSEVRGKASIYVEGVPVTITIEDKVATYNGSQIAMDTAKVTNADGNATGQKITYEYYPTAECNKADRSKEAPVNAGTYYVLASAAACDKYEYTKTAIEDAAVLTVNKREAELVQVPVSAISGDGENEYRIYINKALEVLEGTINLEIWADGVKVGETDTPLAINDEGYASYSYGEIEALVGEANDVKVIASYNPPAEADNYIIEDNELQLSKNGEEVSLYTVAKHEIAYTTYRVLFGTFRDIWGSYPPSSYTYTWFFDNDNDIANITVENSSMTIEPVNAGTVTTVAYVNAIEDGVEKSYYLMEVIEITECNRKIDIGENTFTYDGTAHACDIQMYEYSGYPEKKYEWISAADAEVVYVKDGVTYEEAIEAGTYTMNITIPESRNYYELVDESQTIVIQPAEPTITVSNKIVVYNGEPQALDTAVVSGISGGSEVTGEITYYYQGINGTEYESSEAPVNAGIYSVTATVAADGNYAAATSEAATFIISPVTESVGSGEKDVPDEELPDEELPDKESSKNAGTTSTEKEKAVDTGDHSHWTLYFLLMMASLVIIIKSRKYARR